jgi:type II secretory pathway pseudopilin PulG
MRNIARSSGLSLLELLLVLTLAGAVAGTAVLGVAAVQRRGLLRRAAAAVEGILEHESLQAISTGKAVVLTFDRESGTIVRVRERSATPPATGPAVLPTAMMPTAERQAAETGAVVYSLPGGISFGELRLPRLREESPRLGFSPDGTATPGTITLVDDASAASCSVVQALGGRRRFACEEIR